MMCIVRWVVECFFKPPKNNISRTSTGDKAIPNSDQSQSKDGVRASHRRPLALTERRVASRARRLCCVSCVYCVVAGWLWWLCGISFMTNSAAFSLFSTLVARRWYVVVQQLPVVGHFFAPSPRYSLSNHTSEIIKVVRRRYIYTYNFECVNEEVRSLIVWSGGTLIVSSCSEFFCAKWARRAIILNCVKSALNNHPTDRNIYGFKNSNVPRAGIALRFSLPNC